MKHVYGVGFIRQSLDLHRFEKGGMDCLGYNLRQSGKTAMVIHGSYVTPWGSNLGEKKAGVLWICAMHVRIFFTMKNVCLMPRIKFGSDTMLNIYK